MTATDHAPGAFELIVLGAGPAYSDRPGDLGSGFLVRLGEEGIVLDLGQGTFNPLVRAFDPSALAAVAISHLHPDHFIDLIPLRHYLCRPELRPTRRVPLLAPRGIADRVDAAWGEVGFSAVAFDLELPPTDGPTRAGPFTIEARRVTHAGESCAYRVAIEGQPGPGIVYSGDVGDRADLRPLIRPGDVLLGEATFGPGPVREGMLHLDAPTIGRLAAEARASQLIVAHVRMGYDLEGTLQAARQAFGGPTSMARPGDRFVV
jgi:ribonuclease BN (tRNA processing enzyme)